MSSNSARQFSYQQTAKPPDLLRPSLRTLAKNWWPVLAWLGVIRLESTSTASASNTTQIVYAVVATVYPRVEHSFVEQLDEVLRKSGHFLGYGILAVVVFFALRNTNRDQVRALLPRTWGTQLHDLWRLQWAWIGLLMTVLTAAFDEMHQTFLATRTGRWQDVLIDAGGATVLLAIVYLLSRRTLSRRRAMVEEPESVASS